MTVGFPFHFCLNISNIFFLLKKAYMPIWKHLTTVKKKVNRLPTILCDELMCMQLTLEPMGVDMRGSDPPCSRKSVCNLQLVLCSRGCSMSIDSAICVLCNTVGFTVEKRNPYIIGCVRFKPVEFMDKLYLQNGEYMCKCMFTFIYCIINIFHIRHWL